MKPHAETRNRVAGVDGDGARRLRLGDDSHLRRIGLREHRLWDDPGGPRGNPWFYPPGQREACLRVLTALAQLEAQRQRGELSELAFLTRAVVLINGPDATAVVAASTAPNGGWLGERKHAYEQALEAAQRFAVRP